jgi:hypothetical protein
VLSAETFRGAWVNMTTAATRQVIAKTLLNFPFINLISVLLWFSSKVDRSIGLNGSENVHTFTLISKRAVSSGVAFGSLSFRAGPNVEAREQFIHCAQKMQRYQQL